MREERYYFTYIMTNQRHAVLYTGVTNNILNREYQHKRKINKNSFTTKYNVDKLVYYETYNHIGLAIQREKQIKAGSRQNKINLINNINPEWKDLIEEDFY